MAASPDRPGGRPLPNFDVLAWLAYGLVSASGRWTLAALLALIVATANVAYEFSRKAAKLMSCTTAGFFAFALVTTLAAGPALFRNYNIFVTWLVFAAVTWIALLVGFPFTIQYAREQAPREIWDDPLFVRLNVILSVVFGAMFTVNAGLGAIAMLTGHPLVLGLILPMSLLIAAIVFSRLYPKYYSRRMDPGADRQDRRHQ